MLVMIFLSSCSLGKIQVLRGLRITLFEEPLRKEMNTNLGIGLQEESLQGRGTVGRASPAPWYMGFHSACPGRGQSDAGPPEVFACLFLCFCVFLK